MSEREVDATKLPKYVRDHIKRLERERDEALEREASAMELLHEKARKDSADTDTVIETFDLRTAGFPLDRGSLIKFALSDRRYDHNGGFPDFVSVRVRNGDVEVMGSATLMVELHSSNLFTLRLARS